MEHFKILSQKENHLFKRKETHAETKSKTMPNKKDVDKFFSEKFSAPIENIEIKKIDSRFGSDVFYLTVFIYDSKELRDEIELKPKKAVSSPAQ